MKLALVQMKHAGTKKENLDRMMEIIKKNAPDNDIIVFPETCMGTDSRGLRHLAEDILTGTYAAALRGAAKEYDTSVCAGLWEDSGSDRVFNTAVVYGADGGLLAAYRKLHLFDALSVRESDTMLCGDAVPPVFSVGGVKCSLAVCYDLRFPEVFRGAALAGAEAFIVPAAWYSGEQKAEHLRCLLMARALENTAYCAAADMCGGAFCGGSAVFDPYGICLASAAEEESVITAEISPERVSEIRNSLPCLANLRKDVFYK